jgi:hypothetical protein
VKEGVDPLAPDGEAYFLPLQSGHGHWSQPQPVHAFRSMDWMIVKDSSRDPAAAVPEAQRRPARRGEDGAVP